jgi:type IV pilus assembly protein PilV
VVRLRLGLRLSLAGGFTLIEVLVAVLVLAIGILGASATQLAALRTRHQSRLMSDGVQLASALADSMRANLQAMGAADSVNPYLQLRYDAALDGAPPPAPPCLAGAGCSGFQLAEADLDQVRQALHAGFPGGRVAVCRDSQVWDAGRGALRWACGGGSGAPIVIKLGWRGKEIDGGDARDGAGDFAPSVAIALPGVAQ